MKLRASVLSWLAFCIAATSTLWLLSAFPLLNIYLEAGYGSISPYSGQVTSTFAQPQRRNYDLLVKENPFSLRPFSGVRNARLHLPQPTRVLGVAFLSFPKPIHLLLLTQVRQLEGG